MLSRISIVFIYFIVVLAGAMSADAQTKKRKPPVKKKPVAAVAVKKEPEPEPPPVDAGSKRNERPGETVNGNTTIITIPKVQKPEPVYFYEFTQPEFVTSRILIEHDDAGKGKIAFVKRGSSDLITDPVTVSPAVLEKLKAAFTELNFLDSSEDYQDKRDFSHLGTMRIAMKKDGRERSAAFNWTPNKTAKLIADEYRKIANQYLWMFDISIARENQPLESPKLMGSLDGLLRRNEISDGEQMIPFLQGLADDERLPLIARNHSTKLIAQIEKSIKKKK